jgi:transposase-like protein
LQVNSNKLIDESRCYQTVRELRWPDGAACPDGQSTQVTKRGVDDTDPARQRYACLDCHPRCDELTDTIVAGHPHPLQVWVRCLYFMGLKLSNEPIANELGVNRSDVPQRTTQRREGIGKTSPR